MRGAWEGDRSKPPVALSGCEAVTACPLCGAGLGAEHRVREMMLGLRHQFRLRSCSGCASLVLIDPPSDLGPYYPSDYYSLRPRPRAGRVVRLAKRLRAEFAVRGHRRLARAFGLGAPLPGWAMWLEVAGLDRSASICDIGCGQGDGLIDLLDNGFTDLVGADPFIAATTRREGVLIHEALVEDVPGTYDLVTFNHSFEHVPDPLPTLRHARKLLAPGGTLMLRTPVAGCWAWRHYGTDWVALDAPRHAFIPSMAGLRAAAAAAELEIYAAVYDSTDMQFWRSEQYRLDIPLFDPASHQVDPSGSRYSRKSIRLWRREAERLNEARDGDTVAVFLRRAGSAGGGRTSGPVSAPPQQRLLRVLMASPDPRDPGGITGVVASWRAAGLAGRIELIELPTSAMKSRPATKLAQAAWAALRLLPKLVGRRRVDVVHMHASTGGSLLRKLVLSWLCRICRVPYVVHEHSGELEDWIGASRPRRAAARSLYGGAAVAIVLAERWEETMRMLGARRIEVVPNGLSAPERATLGRAREIRSANQGTDDRASVLLFYGRWAPKKGPDRLASALRGLSRTDYEVHVYGSGDRRSIVAAFDGVGGEVEIRGWLEGEHKVEELGRATALIAPSRAEGLPVALVEARAAGTPVIASDVGGVGEALRGYDSGLLLDPADDDALRDAIEGALAGSWPPAGEPPELPPALWAETSVEHLVRIYRTVAVKR